MNGVNFEKKLLVITYKYYPLIAPRAFRWHTIAQEWARQGYEVDVVCCAYHDLSDYEQVNGVNIYRIKPYLFKWFYSSNWHQKPVQDKQDIQKPELFVREKKSSFLFYIFKITPALLRKFMGRIYNALCWPDSGMLWIPPAFLFSLNLLKKKKYDAILAVSWPVSGHVIGSLLKRVFKQIPLLVDIGDPFSINTHTLSNNVKIYRWLNSFFEKYLFNQAEHITVTTRQTKEKYQKTFPEASSKIVVIPPIFMPAPSVDENINSSILSNNKNIKLVFIGSLKKNNRPPDILLQYFSRLIQEDGKKYELHMVGDITQCQPVLDQYIKSLPEQIYLHGILLHEKALQFQRDADVLINIGNISDYQVPSKLIDYMASGKPIVNLMLTPKDTSAELMANYPSLCNLDGYFQDQNVIFNQFKDFLTHLPPILTKSETESVIRPFMPDVLSRQYLNLIFPGYKPVS